MLLHRCYHIFKCTTVCFLYWLKINEHVEHKQGHIQDFNLGERETSGQRPRGTRPEGPRAGVEFLGGCSQPPPHITRAGSGGALGTPSPAWSGAEHRPPSAFTTVEVLRKILSRTNIDRLVNKIDRNSVSKDRKDMQRPFTVCLNSSKLCACWGVVDYYILRES